MSAREPVSERVRRAVPSGARRAIRTAAKAVGDVTADQRVLPDFLVVGAQRAGTTTLYHHLVQHPQILGAVADKEVHHFDLRDAEGLRAYRAAFPRRGTVQRAARRAGARIVVGEATPYYLFHPAVPARVRAALPDVRLVAVLRDPVSRAWSHHGHEVDLGYEDLPFEAALDREEERLAGEEQRLLADPRAESFAHQHFSYVARGRYIEQLERWWHAFPREQLLLLRSEDLHRDPAETLRSIERHLGVGAWSPPVWRTINASAGGRSMAPGTRERLQATFAPWNERLRAATGIDWDWG
jgi:sulfotransferase family protein